jgi:1,6-anhydro-N-acetylmuramate kinase
MDTVRCKYFSIEVEEIHVPDATVVLRLPVRRCGMAERMIGFISGTEAGAAAALKLRIDHLTGNSASDAAPATPEQIRAAFGPDLEPIHQAECTVRRCRESCTLHYQTILRHFDLRELAEQETGVGCHGGTE